MPRKLLAIAVLAGLALFLVPNAANAVTYVPASPTVCADTRLAPNEAVTVTPTGPGAGSVCSSRLTVILPDDEVYVGAASVKLAVTGYDLPAGTIWAGAGALLLGLALIVTPRIRRRRRLNA